MYKIVIDANSWIKYARIKNIAPLLDRLVAYRLLPAINNYLLSEIFNTLIHNKWMHAHDASKIISFIEKISYATQEKAIYAMSPDPKDNYLFDLAIQNNCLFILTDDSQLLNLKLKPVPVHSSAWFLKKFPLT